MKSLVIETELVEIDGMAGTVYAVFVTPADPHSPIRVPVCIDDARALGAKLFEKFTLTIEAGEPAAEKRSG